MTLTRRHAQAWLAGAIAAPLLPSAVHAQAPWPRQPVHLLVDSTGLKLCGPGEWLVEKHGTRPRRGWRKLHPAADADTARQESGPPRRWRREPPREGHAPRARRPATTAASPIASFPVVSKGPPPGSPPPMPTRPDGSRASDPWVRED